MPSCSGDRVDGAGLRSQHQALRGLDLAGPRSSACWRPAFGSTCRSCPLRSPGHPPDSPPPIRARAAHGPACTSWASPAPAPSAASSCTAWPQTPRLLPEGSPPAAEIMPLAGNDKTSRLTRSQRRRSGILDNRRRRWLRVKRLNAACWRYSYQRSVFSNQSTDDWRLTTGD